MDYLQQKQLKEAIIEKYLDGMSVRDLENFFYDIQYDNLSDYSETELLEEAYEFFSEDEIAALTSLNM